MMRPKELVWLAALVFSTSHVDSFSALRALAQRKSRASSLSASRRDILDQILSGMLIVGFSSTLGTETSQAACLPGDTSRECIGVYKAPIDIDTMTQENKDAFRKFAPDVKTDVKPMAGMPRTSDEALQVLEAQRAAADDIMNAILQGRLEEGGIKVLNLIPRVSMAGRIVIRDGLSSPSSSSSSSTLALASMSSQDMERTLQREASIHQLKETQLESALSNVLNSFGECDVMIGQGIRGEMGVVTFAQIYILFELQDAIRAYDDFLCIARKHCVSST